MTNVALISCQFYPFCSRDEETHDGDWLIITGVMRPIKTVKHYQWRMRDKKRSRNTQLFVQLEAVLSATPLLLIDRGKTSLGSTQPMGPKETPYAAVKVYIPLGMVSGRHKERENE